MFCVCIYIYITFVGGGSGFVGRYMQKCFRRKGYNVKIISRSPQKDALTWVRQKVASTCRIDANCDEVIKCAALT